jgi:hypothetical protein
VASNSALGGELESTEKGVFLFFLFLPFPITRRDVEKDCEGWLVVKRLIYDRWVMCGKREAGD